MKRVIDIFKGKSQERRVKEIDQFLTSIIIYICNNYNQLEQELRDLEIYFVGCTKSIGAYKQIEVFMNDFSCSYRFVPPKLDMLNKLYKDIQTGLSKKYADNFLVGMEAFNFKRQMANNSEERGEAILFVFDCILHVKGILSNLERIKNEQTNEGKLAILKGMLVYY